MYKLVGCKVLQETEINFFIKLGRKFEVLICVASEVYPGKNHQYYDAGSLECQCGIGVFIRGSSLLFS